jgi:hypothetical protein
MSRIPRHYFKSPTLSPFLNPNLHNTSIPNLDILQSSATK